MLDLGFLPDIERILRQIPDERQAMLFSATMPDPIITLARTFMNQPTHIRAEAPQSRPCTTTTEQFAYRAHALDKVELVARHAAGPRPRRDDGLHPHQAHRAEGGRRARRARLQGRRRARRPGPDRPREGAQGVPHRRDRRAGGHRRRRARHRHRRHHPRHQLPDPRGRAGLRAPHRPHRPGGQDRRRDHAGRLGRADALDDDRQGARARTSRIPPRHIPARRICTKSWTSRPTPRAPSAPARAAKTAKRPPARCRRARPPATAPVASAHPWRQAGQRPRRDGDERPPAASENGDAPATAPHRLDAQAPPPSPAARRAAASTG